MNELLEAQGGKLTTSRHMTFCNLCDRKVNKLEEVYSFTEGKFVIHVDCNTYEVKQRENRTHFLKNTKKRSYKKKPAKSKSGAKGVDRNKLFYGK